MDAYLSAGRAARRGYLQGLDSLGHGELSALGTQAGELLGEQPALTEVALLGNVALRFPHETLEYDAEAMRFPGRPEADAHLSPTIRGGWAIDGM